MISLQTAPIDQASSSVISASTIERAPLIQDEMVSSRGNFWLSAISMATTLAPMVPHRRALKEFPLRMMSPMPAPAASSPRASTPVA